MIMPGQPDDRTAAGSAESKEPAGPTGQAGWLGRPMLAERIELPVLPPDRTWAYALAIVAFLHLIALASAIRLDAAMMASERERQGQLESSNSISVELVEAPDPDATSRKSQAGVEPTPASDAKPAASEPTTASTEPQPPAQQATESAALELAPTPDPKPELHVGKPAERPSPKPPPKPVTVEDLDPALLNLSTALSPVETRILGAGAKGRQSPYAASVHAALSRSKPRTARLTGDVFILFTLTPAGKLKSIEIVKSSGNPNLDAAAVEAIKGTRYPVPPPNVEPRDLRYLIHYAYE